MDEDVKDPNRSASPGLSLTGDMILELRQDQDPRRLIESARKIRILFSQESPPQVDDVLFNSLALELVQLLKRSKDPVVQFEVGAILSNMCSGTTEQTRVVVNSGALPELVHLMRSSDIKVRMHAVRALGNIMCDDGQFRELVTAYNFVRALVDLINSTDIDSKVEKELEFLRGAAWVLHIFCRDKEPLIDLEVIEQILPALLSLIVSDDLSVLIKTLLTITSIAEFGPRYSQLVIRSDLVREVARLLSHKEPIIDALARKTLTGLGIPIITLDVKSLFTGCSSE